MRTIYDIESLPLNATICIYGAGSRGAMLAGLIEKNRKDITLSGFLDSFEQGTFEGKRKYLADTFLATPFSGTIVIASTFVKPITEKLQQLGINNYLVFEEHRHNANSIRHGLRSVSNAFLSAGKSIGVVRDAVNLICQFALQTVQGRRRIITMGEASYMGDGFATTHHVDFLHDEKFINSYNNAWDKTPGSYSWQMNTYNVAWRAHIATWAASRALNLEGDFVECGVWYGVLSKTICEYTDFANKNKNFYLFDSWGCGVSPEHDMMNPEYKIDIFDLVKERFAKYPNVHLTRGLVPESLNRVSIDKIAYLSIDMNGHVPERATLEKYYEKIVPGGVIYFDDYGWNYPKLRETVKDFFKDKPETLLHFPSGNSIVIKL